MAQPWLVYGNMWPHLFPTCLKPVNRNTSIELSHETPKSVVVQHLSKTILPASETAMSPSWLCENLLQQLYLYAKFFRWVSSSSRTMTLTPSRCCLSAFSYQWWSIPTGHFPVFTERPMSSWCIGLIPPQTCTRTHTLLSASPFTACVTQPQTLFITTSNGFSFSLHPSH